MNLPAEASPDEPLQQLGAIVSRAFLADEATTVEALAASARLDPATAARVHARAARLVVAVREEQRSSGTLQSFLHQYSLSTPEGVLLMCVAEALLRIPDVATADRLIRDKFSHGDWQRHLGASDSLLVNAGTWGLMLSGRLARVEEIAAASEVGDGLSRLAARLGEPVLRLAVRQAMKILASQFVMGRNIGEALARAQDANHRRYRCSFDMLGEAALTWPDAERYYAAYVAAIEAVGKARDAGVPWPQAPSVSVKLSALHPRYEVAQRERVLRELTPRVLALARAAHNADINLTIDAEEAERLELSLEIFERVLRASEPGAWDGFGLAVQAYQKRALPVIHWLAQLAHVVERRIPVRLVKGAYWDSEIKRAQQHGLASYPVFTRKAGTDVSYLACANAMIAAGAAFYPQFATHNAHTVAYLLERVGPRRDFEFQRLHGMGAALYDRVLTEHDIACRVYAPVGSHEDLLPYLVRRLLENGANTSFVNRIADAGLPVDAVIADPVETLAATAAKSDPRIPLPRDIYAATRINSAGLSFADPLARAELERAMQPHIAAPGWAAMPLVGGRELGGRPRTCFDPADRSRAIGAVLEAEPAMIEAALQTASAAAAGWDATPAETRAALLDRAAEAIESRRAELMAMLVREAGKTVPDALGEVREAVDLLRYYAAEARRLFAAPLALPGPTGESNTLALHGRGVFACISPWNFPLAIFLGQVAAALAAGNAVIAKPAEQTPLIATAAVRVLLDAGVPPGALALLPGDGETVGAPLVADARIAGVCFTGSTAVAKAIQRSLAARDGPIATLIAETGGINALIADSSALPEQLVQDVLASAFNSAGQRCSALRVLLVQEDIAERVLTMLAGATQTLMLGDPGELSTDIGPVIDEAALAALQSHAQWLANANNAGLIGNACLPDRLNKGLYFAPLACEIGSLAVLREEVFGPILHLVRYREKDLDRVVDAINAKGYGLTLGIHSRIDATVRRIVARARVGNIYVNRNLIGAVVGSQPFGGEGLSGTGPKAGGPHYLLRFATERTLAINSAAAGGNARLTRPSQGSPPTSAAASASRWNRCRCLRAASTSVRIRCAPIY